MNDALSRLKTVLADYKELVVAVSGGIDSLTLACVAGDIVPNFAIAHAMSPAVPKPASDRVTSFAKQFRWDTHLIEAGEFSDPNYLNNPVNRCYFCKSNLYQRIGEVVKGQIASGANLDDLGDFRPGLTAAKEQSIVHPFIDAQITKNEIREIARSLKIKNIAELPAQPCLASRVETGLAITPIDMGFIFQVETLVGKMSDAKNIRCRVTHEGIRLEVDNHFDVRHLTKTITEFCERHDRHFVGISAYQKGSAFLNEIAHG